MTETLNTSWRGANCLVTGGVGFIGSHLCAALHERGARVVSVDVEPPHERTLFSILNRGKAIQTFTAVIEKRPDFAEGWNKRATLYYLVGEYDKSLRDCDEVMKRNPGHFGALAGYGQIYLQLDRPERALEYFQRALAVNPNMPSVEAAVAVLKRLIIEKRRGVI